MENDWLHTDRPLIAPDFHVIKCLRVFYFSDSVWFVTTLASNGLIDTQKIFEQSPWTPHALPTIFWPAPYVTKVPFLIADEGIGR